jgi:hypothetical protein
MSDLDRRARAQARRSRAILHKGRLQATEAELDPLRGAEALSLVHRLTRESWSLSGREEPVYPRAQIPCRFVRGRLT